MVRIQNIYYMLSYAFQSLNEKESSKYGAEEFEYIDDLFTVILAKGISKQLKQGLGREYVIQTEELISPKGKINISETVKLRAIQKKSLSCDVDEYVENTYMNQILKSTSMYLLHSKDVKKENKQQLKKVMLFFSNVDLIDCKSIVWNRLQYNRNNISYKMLMNICYLIVNGMLISDEVGKYKLSRYLDDQQMCTLYEKFILEYYRKHYPKFSVSPAYIQWDEDNGMIELLPKMRSDITIEDKETGKILIIDAKYYDSAMQHNVRYGNETIHSHNLYQIFTYVKNKDIDHDGSVSGMLLYANTDGNNPDKEYMMSGNKISVKTLDLNCEFELVKKQLSLFIFDWCAGNNNEQ